MSICELYQLIRNKKPSFKSAPKLLFTLYKGTVGSLELAQKLKAVKNFEKKKDFRGAIAKREQESFLLI